MSFNPFPRHLFFLKYFFSISVSFSRMIDLQMTQILAEEWTVQRKAIICEIISMGLVEWTAEWQLNFNKEV